MHGRHTGDHQNVVDTRAKKEFNTNVSKHFIGTGVRATGLKSFIALAYFDLGTGMILEVFHMTGIVFDLRDKLKIYFKISDNLCANIFKIIDLIKSGLHAFLGLTLYFHFL